MTRTQLGRLMIAFGSIAVLLTCVTCGLTSLLFSARVRFFEVEIPRITFVEETVEIPRITVDPAVANPTESFEAPVLFDADSCAPEENPDGCSLDVGVNPGQVGVVFGWHIAWPKGNLDAGGNGCDLAVLRPGWYENLKIHDGRYEVYNVPQDDYGGWLEVLATQRADEQAANYSCPAKDFENIPQWDSSSPSPPTAEPTATPTVEACERRTTGENKSLRFNAGEAVYGWRITLDTGKECDGGKCYLLSAPSSGEVTSGVICPWPEEVQGVNPWDPSK